MKTFDDVLTKLRAAGEETRLRALLLLASGDLTVSELTQVLGQSQPRVSRHLKILAEAGLVDRQQEGAWTFYRLAEGAMSALGIAMADVRALLPDADRAALVVLQQDRRDIAARYFAEHAADWAALRARHIDEAAIEARLMALAGPPVDTFLDLGTGTGRMLEVFQAHYQRGIGLDASAEMLSIARARLIEAGLAHAHVRRSDFLDDPLPDDVDIVCLHHVLHFLVLPEEAIGVAARSLTPAGRILIADFAPHQDEELRDRFAHRRLGFSDQEITACAAKHGLSVTATDVLPPPVAGGLITHIWRLEPARQRARRAVTAFSEDHHARA